MDFKITKHKFEVVESFKDYVAQGGSIISFAEYYLFKNETEDQPVARNLVILALCEELVLARDYEKMYEVLHAMFSLNRWKLDHFKDFLAHTKESEILSPFYQSIFALYENCKNYVKSC
jgi:hypothetical protein